MKDKFLISQRVKIHDHTLNLYNNYCDVHVFFKINYNLINFVFFILLLIIILLLFFFKVLSCPYLIIF